MIRSISPYSVRMWENTDQKTPNADTFQAVVLATIALQLLYEQNISQSWVERYIKIEHKISEAY